MTLNSIADAEPVLCSEKLSFTEENWRHRRPAASWFKSEFRETVGEMNP